MIPKLRMCVIAALVAAGSIDASSIRQQQGGVGS